MLRRPRAVPSRGLLVIVGLGVLVRLAWSWYAARVPAGLHDPGLYRLLARNIADGHGYTYPVGPTAYYPPGYPAALAVVVWLVLHTPLPGNETVAVVFLNVLAGAVTIVLTAALARRLAGERAALVAAALVALWPNLIVHSAVALSETLFLPLALAIVLLALDGPWPSSHAAAPRLAALGMLVGGATLVRPVALPLLGVLVVAWVLGGLRWQRAVAHTLVVAAVALLVLVPWAVRNHRVVGAYVLSTNTGDNLCMSRQPGADGAFLLTSYCAADIPDQPRGDYERLRDEQGRRRAIDFVRDHPLTELRLWPQRLWHTVENDFDGLRAAESYGDDPFLSGGVRRTLQIVSDVWFLVALAAAIIAVPFAWRRDRRVAVVVIGAIVATVVLPAVAFFGDPRFHVPAVPFIAALAAVVVSDRRRLA